MRRFLPSVERFESRTLQTLVFVFNGNAYAKATPNEITRYTAGLLAAHGDQAVQLTMPAMDGADAFNGVVRQVRAISKGRPIGLIGFSAGGTLALRLAGVPGLKVRAAAGFYAPPDLRNWLQFHQGDRDFRFVTTHVQLNKDIIRLLSGPSTTTARVIDAFGLRDHTVVASPSAANFKRDFPNGQVYYYDGPHGVRPTADPAALRDFLNHL